MPYLEDGETWHADISGYEEGMAENKPGHKSFSEYQLPGWVKHPIGHPWSGVPLTGKEYMHASGDGLSNRLGWSLGHIGAKFGDLDILEMCTPEELDWQDANGNTPASYAAQHGTAWVLQWLVDHDADTKTPNYDGKTPWDWVAEAARYSTQLQQYCFEGLQGNLLEKNSIKAQEEHILTQGSWGQDPVAHQRIQEELKKSRKFWFNTVDFPMPYRIPGPEELSLDLVAAAVTRRKAIKPPVPVALLFPGSTAQRIGMISAAVCEKDPVKDMLKKATAQLGWDVKQLITEGPLELLLAPRHWAATFVANAAAMLELEATHPEEWARPQAVAGLAFGEYSALYAAGVLSFDDGLRLAKEVGEATEAAGKGVTLSVAGLSQDKVEGMCKEAAEATGGHCFITEVLFETGFICAGAKEAIDKVAEAATAARAMQVKKSTRPASNSPLMEAAAERVDALLDELLPRMSPSRCAIYFNDSGQQVPAGTEPAVLIRNMRRHMTSRVKMLDTIQSMIRDGVKTFLEVGPGKGMQGILKRVDPEAFKHCEKVAVDG